MRNLPPLGYEPSALAREMKRHYISASDSDLKEMLAAVGKNDLRELYAHVPEASRYSGELPIPPELSYTDLQKCLFEISQKNNLKLSFLGDGLPQFKVQSIVPHVLSIRRLTTAYTPYQPERSQGTLATHWIYQCAVSALTGFEAVNASFYERSTALFEAMKCAQRLVRGSDTVIIAGSLYPGDIEVLQTQAEGTDLKIVVVPLDVEKGIVDLAKVETFAREVGLEKIAALVFPQINCLGNLEMVDGWADLARSFNCRSIAVIDPILLGQGCLKTPREFGSQGTDMFVAEGQHLAIGPNFGGPGLGIFGIRFNDECKNDIRQTAGRYVGKGKDMHGRDAYAIVLSTREQHIRREKATSNICSNQAYIATVAGAALLERGAEGITQSATSARDFAHAMAKRLTRYTGVKLAFRDAVFFNEFVLQIPKKTAEVIAQASEMGVHVGVDVGARLEKRSGNFLLISFSDIHSAEDCDRLDNVFGKIFGAVTCDGQTPQAIPASATRKLALPLTKIPVENLKRHYDLLGEQNVSPDENIYALGSCTMKYNPYINDWAAALDGFTNIHPEAPEADVQGALQIIYETQEYFKAITGLAAVTTQPVAGAQGELVGLKLFQAYHKSRGDHGRDIVLIPRTAHGTNPATATMAGFITKETEAGLSGVVLIESDSSGQIDFAHLKTLVSTYGKRIAGVMVTNPNTSGVLETSFREMAAAIHDVGGLVYMDGANMNAIAGWLDLGKLGVDAVHNNTHKTWTIPHGGGGPGDAFVAVSAKLVDFLPGIQVEKNGEIYRRVKPKKSIGSFHRHMGNFAHKVRCYTYLRALGKAGVPRMAAVAVLSANYLYKELRKDFPTLPAGADSSPRMHEFILTLDKEMFAKVEAKGMKKSDVIPRVGKLFLDFGLHAPTVAFPEVFGLMIEPTESYTKSELDRFLTIVGAIRKIVDEHPEVLFTVPHFTPIDKVDEVGANKDLTLSERILELPKVLPNRISSRELDRMAVSDIAAKILVAHKAASRA